MQTINRNNYEEFFLLYVDCELSAEDRFAVENFVQHNTDLAVELEMLMHTKFSPEEIGFTDKEHLLRTEGNNINETNYEEYFLLYIDNELSAAKREEVEMYVLQHPQLQDEFTTLKQTILAPEVISYGNKKDLYRTEKRRAIYLKPWRLAAAAIFIGVCAVGFWMMQRPGVKVPLANTQSQQIERKQSGTATKSADTVQQKVIQQQQVIAEQTPPEKENKISSKAAVVQKKKDKGTNITADKNQNNEEEQVASEHTVIQHNNITQQQKEPPAEIHDIAVIPENLSTKQNEVAALQTPDVNTQNESGYNVYPVAYKEINTNDDDRSLHVGMFDLNKNKVKTLFKKAGRMFGNKSNNLANGDGKLQVASFEIDTKKQ